MVGNDDLSKFESLSKLPTQEVRTDLNVRVKQYEQGDKSYLFETNSNGPLVEKDVLDLSIKFEKQTNGKIYPINKSFVHLTNGGEYNYSWEFEDGSTSTLVNPEKSVIAGEKIKLTLVQEGKEKGNTTATVRGDDDFCDHYFRIEDRGDCNFRVTIELAWQDGVIGKVEWTLPDGSTKDGTNTWLGNTVDVNIDGSDGSLQGLTITLYDQEGEIICTATYGLRCKCGTTGNTKDETSKVTISGKKWKADVEIWSKDALFFASSTGSKTITKRKGWVGYVRKDADKIAASFKGTLLDKAEDGCPEIAIPYEEEVEEDSHYLERNVNTGTNEARYEPDADICESTHWFRVNGVTVRYTKNGGKLFLN